MCIQRLGCNLDLRIPKLPVSYKSKNIKEPEQIVVPLQSDSKVYSCEVVKELKVY
jgi:hypothetical protein